MAVSDVASVHCASLKRCLDDLDPVVVGERHDQCLAGWVEIWMRNSGVDKAAVDGFCCVDLDVWCPWSFE